MKVCRKFNCSLLSAWALLAVVALALSASRCAANAWPDEVPNFSMLDLKGRYYEFHRAGSRVLVLFFTENGCPIARQCLHKLAALRDQFPESDLAIWAVDATPADDRMSIYKEADQLHLRHVFPFLRDDSQGVAQMLGVTRTATVVAISTKDGHVFYHGALDDQFSEGASKPEATQKYLEDALRAFLAGQPVKQAITPAHGCLISLDAKLKDAEISYAREVAPILEKHCVQCHSAGNIGPFSFSNYDKVKSKSDMIQEVLLSRRMPPWSADPEIGHYQNERTMTLDETRTLLGWIARGSPRGEGPDPLPDVKIPPAPEWPLGAPDFVVKLPQPEKIPATGVLEYRHIKIEASVAEDTWVGAVAIKPGNRKVLHHCIVRVQSPKSEDDGTGRGTWLQGWAPGIQSKHFPEGTGRLIPKGSVLDLELHYTTMGSPQSDETEIGFYKLPGRPKFVLRNQGAYNLDFSIPPGDENAETEATLAFPRDTMLYAMSPHMHLRGSWMRYEALYPGGKRETLLSVPDYDFNWQTTYALPTPKLLPAGTWILCTGGFDNSAQNPANPAPSQRVAWGDQSFNEMFIGFMETAELPKTAELAPAAPTAER
jgi:peroxiredoxin